MKPRALGTALVVIALASASPARADPPPSTATTTGQWGWLVVGASIVAGAAIVTGALTIDCTPDDRACAHWTSLGIIGGFGVAAVGSVAGILVVEAGARRRTVAFGPTGIAGTF